MKPYTPFVDTGFNLQFIAFSLSEILKYGLGFDARTLKFVPKEYIDGVVAEATDNPYIVDAVGEKQFYQRDLVWKHSDKQNLIDAIYNYSDIGKFVVIRNGFDHL